MRKKIQFISTVIILLLVLGFFTEKLFHHSFEKFILSTLQRVDYQPEGFSKNITIIDTSPIFDLTTQRTNRAKLADLLQAVKLGQPESVGLDIRLGPNSLYKDVIGDSLLKAVLKDWQNIVIPGNIDPFFSITDSSRLANIQIHDGYELLVARQDQLSLPFRMAANHGIDIPKDENFFIVNYRTTFNDLSGSDRLLKANELMQIYYDESLSQQEKQDQLGMMLASQFVFIGFCNDALNIDRHQTPFGKQSGILIWANAFNNILQPEYLIQYNPWWGIVLWICVTLIVIFFLNYVNRNLNFYYSIVLILMSMGQVLIWSSVGVYIYFSNYSYLPIFSFLLVALVTYPAIIQLNRLSKMATVVMKYPHVSHVPEPMKSHYINYLKESNPFKQLHYSFTLVEECVHFIVFFGLAQAMSFNINLKNILKNKDFNKLTFGEWQGLMRDISEKLNKNNRVLNEWKMFYNNKDDNGKWIPNQLFKDLDGIKNKNIVDKLEEKENDIKQKLVLLEGKTSGVEKIKYLVLKMFYFSYSKSSNKYAIKFKQHFEKVRHLIDIRNGLVHHGGVFMEDEDYYKIHNMFEGWLDQFLTQKMLFWKHVSLSSSFDKNKKKLYIEIDNIKFALDPFYQVTFCAYHNKDELFLLSKIDIDKRQITYRGIGPDCWFVLENAFEEGDSLFNFLKLNGK